VNWLFFFRRDFIVLSSSCICEHSRQTLKHVLLFCANWFAKHQRMLREEETTNIKILFNFKKRFKSCCQLIDENQFINSIFIDQRISRLNQHFVRLICHADDLQFLILKKNIRYCTKRRESCLRVIFRCRDDEMTIKL
jgi:hypothetical protein